MQRKTSTMRQFGRREKTPGSTIGDEKPSIRPSATSTLRSACASLAGTATLVLAATTITPGVADAANNGNYDVWNLSGGDIVVDNYARFVDYEMPSPTGLPAAGTRIAPGHNLRVKMANDSYQAVTANLSGSGPKGAQKWAIDMNQIGSKSQIKCRTVTPDTANRCGNYIGTDNNVATVADAPWNDVNVPASNAQKQATTLNDLCLSGVAGPLGIKCVYSNMDQKGIYGAPELPFKFWIVTAGDKGKTKQHYDNTWKSEVSTTLSLSATASASFLGGIVKTGIEAKYTTTKLESTEIKNSLDLNIPPFKTGWICLAAPQYKYTGTLDVWAGWTHWIMEGVTVIGPNPTGHVSAHTFFTDTDLNNGTPDPCPGLVSGKTKSLSGPVT